MKNRVLVSIVAIAAILLLGLGSTVLLIKLRKPPTEATGSETPLRVMGVRVQPEDVRVMITGYGEARALDQVSIAPEVPGRIVEIHPDLEVGGIVPEGETLFVIDPRDYKARLDDARAMVEQSRNAVKRMRTQLANDQERLKTLKRSRDLAKAEYDRLKRLLEVDQVGSQSNVDAAERAYNAAEDMVDQLERALAVYPIQIEEINNSLASAEARMRLAEVNFERTRVVAPFDARVTLVRLEKDQYVAPGLTVVTLADDSILEISVPLDSRDARRWLQFNGDRIADDTAWFSGLDRVTCPIRWTEDKEGHTWEGTLDRVEQFDPTSRTLTVAVRLEGADAFSKDPDQLPLVAGMFCVVEIPGLTLSGAYRLPRWAVSFENTAYVSVDDRLRTVPVEVAWDYGDSVYVSGGLEPGDIVVTTRLVNPLEHSLLDVTFEREDVENI